MSNKGAIKKTLTTKDASKSSSRSKPKNEDSESPGKLDPSHLRRQHISEQRGDGDKRLKLTQSTSSSRVQLSRTSSKQPAKSSQAKPSKESDSTSVSKSSTSISKATSRNSSNTKPRVDTVKKTTSSSTARSSKSIGKGSSGYAEKRGVSTIYMPQSVTSKLSTKSTDRSTSSTLKDKGKLKKSNASGTNKSRTVSRERKLSRTLSPSEVKMLHSATSRSRSSKRKDEEKNKSVEKVISADDAQLNVEDEYNYEDDFEDYESDFQDCTDSESSEVSEVSSPSQTEQVEAIELRSSEKRKTVNSAEHQKVEEEHMHDSGHYELAEARKRAARIESIIANESKSSPLLELRQPINKAYSEDRPSENKSLPSSTDEGFEDSRSGDFTKSPPLSQISIIDFRKAKDVQNTKKQKKNLSRGEELLEMIKLDTMGWSLLECTPIPYEEFIRSYGKLNTQQMCTQTGEDNVEVETQTEAISLQNKWTQFPVTLRKTLKTTRDIELFRMDQIGVGCDDDKDTVGPLVVPTYDALRLSDFLNRAGTVMLSLLEERRFKGNVFRNEKDELPFSDGVVKLSINSVTFLAGRAVTMMHYSELLSKILLTIHAPAEEEIETSSKQDYVTDCCIGCVWNISEPSMPIKLFYSQCLITACCFHLTNYNVVFAGLEDGSISLWDLKEDEMWHEKVTDKANELDWVIRTPTYTTSGNAEMDTHNSQIVALRILSKIEDESLERRNNRFLPIQICSLDEDGILIIWSVLHNMGLNIDDLGLSYWGDIRISKSQELTLKSTNEQKKTNATAFLDMRVDSVETNNLYVATNNTTILHATCIGNKPNPPIYKKHDISPCGNVTCIDVCPFERSFFLVGCDDGTFRLHALNVEKPILQLKDETHAIKIKAVQWSKSKPFIIYVLDNNSRVHIWDLSSSDIHASHVIDMEKWGCIRSMQLSSCRTVRDMNHQYLALGTESGNVEVHKLKSSFCYSKREQYAQDLNTFMKYIAIL